jgi:hypothetical protein
VLAKSRPVAVVKALQGTAAAGCRQSKKATSAATSVIAGIVREIALAKSSARSRETPLAWEIARGADLKAS